MIQLWINRITFFLTKPIHVKCSSCELKLKCLGGPKCIHEESNDSFLMSLYLVSVSAVGTLFVSMIWYFIDPNVLTRNYFLLTWLSGTTWTLLAYHIYYYYKRQLKRKLRGEKS